MPDLPLSDRDLLIEIHTTVKTLTSTDSDHETRIRRLEKIVWIGIGLAAAAGSAAGSAIGQLVGTN